MALSPTDFEFLKKLYGDMQPEDPVEPTDPRYQPWDATAAGDDPVALLSKHIQFSGSESLRLFSGFRGSGKTTQLYRLRQELQAKGYMVLYANALEYLNPAEPLSVELLLVTLAGAFSDALQEAGIDIGTDSYWARLKHYVTKTEVKVSQASAKAQIETPYKDFFGGGKLDFDVKAELKETPSFREKLRGFLESRLKDVKDDVDKFIEDGVKAVRRKNPEAGVVFLFDSLEQLRGSISNEREVYRSVEILFSHHMKMLELPYVHCVYCVPPWLQFVSPNSARISVTIPTVRLWAKDDTRSTSPPGWHVLLREMLRRRFPEGGMARFFGPPRTDGSSALADRLIEMSGGHFRDLLNLMRETVLRAQSLPVDARIVDAAISNVRESFRPIAIDDAKWLDKIAKSRQTQLPSTSSEDVAKLTRFLDTRFVVYLKNGEGWYDVHPLIREGVASLAASS